MADESTPVRIKLTGTDLLRRDCYLAPEFAESQYENPAFPLERCTIYDAGSRSFRVEEYLEDVAHYWSEVGLLAENGVTYRDLLSERTPELDPARFNAVDLGALVRKQLGKAA